MSENNDIKCCCEGECCSCPTPEPPIDPPVPPTPEPEVEDKGRVKPGGWGSVDDNPNNWKVVSMKDNPKLFKVVDKDGVNVADNFNTEAGAKAFVQEHIDNYKPEPKPEPEPEPKPEPDGGQIVEGVKIPYEVTGKKRIDDWNYNENDGLRIDYEGNKFPDFVNNAMVVYAQFVGKVTGKEERGFKWSWARHTGKGTRVNTYIVAIRNSDGKTRVRFEEDHPSGYKTLSDYGESEIGLPAKTGKTFGLMGVRRNVVNKEGKVTGVALELWEDEGGLVNGKPANKWKQLISFVDTKYVITDYSKHGCECTCRMDDDIGDKNIKVEKVLLTEIKPLIK